MVDVVDWEAAVAQAAGVAVAPAEASAPAFRPVVFSPEEWARLGPLVAELDRRSAAARNTRALRVGFNLVGAVGEWAYSRVAGHGWTPEGRLEEVLRRGSFRDGGVDFPPGVDVKAVTRAGDGAMRPVGEPVAAFYAVVLVDVACRSGAYLGYATRGMMLAAPVRQLRSGPNLVVPAAELVRGLPG